jgi:hypothetical protein
LKKIGSFIHSKETYSIELEQNVAKKRLSYSIPKTLLKTICYSLLESKNKYPVLFFNLEQNVLFTIDRTDTSFQFIEMKMLNLVREGVFRKIDKPNTSFSTSNSLFFKSYLDGKQIYIDRKIPNLMKSFSIPPQYISLEEYNLPDGFYSTFLTNNSNIIIDFYVRGNTFYIVNLIKPDRLKFGIFNI